MRNERWKIKDAKQSVDALTPCPSPATGEGSLVRRHGLNPGAPGFHQWLQTVLRVLRVLGGSPCRKVARPAQLQTSCSRTKSNPNQSGIKAKTKQKQSEFKVTFRFSHAIFRGNFANARLFKKTRKCNSAKETKPVEFAAKGPNEHKS
jgi:hypothetical protein